MHPFLKRLFFLGFLAILTSRAIAAPEILSISYTSPDPALFIGSSVTMNMFVLDPTVTVPLTVSYVGSGGTSLTFDFNSNVSVNATLGTVATGEVIFITDGEHTWRYLAPAPLDTVIRIADTTAVGVAGIYEPAVGLKAGSNVGDYNQIRNLTFRAYKGTGLTNPTASNFATVDIGVFDSVSLVHQILGIWQGVYTVPNLDANYNNAGLFGYVVQGSIPAGNNGLQSPQKITIDGVLPKIKDLALTIVPSDPSYNGMMYLSKQVSQGTTTAHFSNKKTRIEFTVNKPDCIVSSRVLTTIPLNMDPVPLGSGVTDNLFWNGTDGSGIFQQDGLYTIEIGITDKYGVVGISKTVDVRVTSLLVDVFDVQLSPQSLSLEPPQVGAPITTISFKSRVRTDDPTEDIWEELENLGWDFHYDGAFPVNKTNPRASDPNPPYAAPYDYQEGLDPRARSIQRVFPLFEVDVLRPDGSVFFTFDKDLGNLTDSDTNFLSYVQEDPAFGLAQLPCRNGFPATHPASATITGAVIADGDTKKGNDWDMAFDTQYTVETGSAIAPNSLIAGRSLIWTGTVPSPGSYKIRIRATLTALEWFFDDPPVTSGAPGTTELCTPPLGGASPLEFYRRGVHFFPTARPEAFPSAGTGRGLYGQDSSSVFVVTTQSPPISDGTPPDLIATVPGSGDVAISGTYGPTTPITAFISDAENQIALGPLGSSIKVLRVSSGGIKQQIVGSSQSDGGSGLNATLKFFPAAPLDIGGSYEIVVNAVDQVGNSAEYIRTFQIEDQAAPDIFQLLLITDTNPIGESIDTLSTQTQGPFSGVTEIHAKINMPSTSLNTIDLTNSTIVLRLTGTAQTIPLTELTHTINSNSTSATLKFSLDSPLVANSVYQIEVTTASTNAAGSTVYFGPANVMTYPLFSVVVPPDQFVVNYSFSVMPAMIVRFPVTVTAKDCATALAIPVTTTTAAIFSAVVPLASAIDATSPPGFQAITQTANNQHALQIVFNTAACPAGLYEPEDVTLDFGVSKPVKLKLYFKTEEVPAVDHSTFVVKGQDATGNWFDLPASQADLVNGTNKPVGTINTVTIDLSAPPVVLYRKYAIFYSVAAAPATVPTATPTPVIFNTTKSFNPGSSNPLARVARIYYANSPAADVQVKIYNTAGQTVRTLDVSNGGVNLSLAGVDPGQGVQAYYFTWDGRNDQGASVRNGIYLVRYRIVKMDGSEEIHTKPVALIK